MALTEILHKPLYVRVKSALRDYLNNHRGKNLPGERELALQLGVSRGTLRQAIRELTAEGILSPQHGRGTLVIELPDAGGNRRILFAVNADLPVYDSELFHEMLREVYRNNMEALTMVLRPTDLGSEYIAKVLHQVDAVVLSLPLASDPDVLAVLRQTGRPVMVIRYAVEGCYTVTDNRAVACEMLVEHLIKLGHRQIAFLGVFTLDPERKCGVMTALNRAGITWRDNLLIESAGSRAQGYRDTSELLKRGVPFTAVVCQNDEHALGVMERLLEAGLKIPADVSIVGFDNIAAAAEYPVPLTTCGAELKLMARKSLQLLLSAATEKEPVHMELNPALIVRCSTGPASTIDLYTKIRT